MTIFFGDQLIGVPRCPHCSVASPVLWRVYKSPDYIPRNDGGRPSIWSVYACTTCGHLVSAKGYETDRMGDGPVQAIYPEPPTAHVDIPDVPRQFLQQAYETLHAPDAAAVMAGSAVDAMLKEKGFVKGSLYDRIDEALVGNVLTKPMADWAHEVRLGSNRPRHADKDNPHVSREEAKQSVDFADALGQFLFVLNARIERGIEEAQEATE